MRNTSKYIGLAVIAAISFVVLSLTACQPEPTLTTTEHVHQWSEWTQTKAATCTAAGEETRVCALDATHTETRTGAAELGHDWEWVVTTPATYTAEGIETKTCKHDPSHTDGTRPIPQLTYTAPNITELGTWLTSQPANTVETPFTVKLNVNDISNIKTTLNAAPDKYVYLDLSGSAIITIPENAFYDTSTSPAARCTTLVGIIIPDSVTSVGSRAFYYCTSLASVTIPDSVTSIGQSAFVRCTSLASIKIPNSVTSIEWGVFQGCASLAEINVDIGNTVYSAENGILYSKDKRTLIQYPIGKTDAFFTIPNSVTSIGGEAFFSCTSLTSVTIPNSVTQIGGITFNDCTNLSSVTFQGTIPSGKFGYTDSPFEGDLRAKYYASNASNGTPGTYTTTAPVGESSVWTKQ
jgi:hypothetical protein